MKKINFNNNWSYYNYENGDRTRKKITLPHDAMILEKRNPNCDNSYNSGYYPGGKYIYEKEFEIQKQDDNEKVFIEFEGVYRDCEVYLNGELVGSNNYGYSNFYIDLSSKILFDKLNHLKVVVDNSKTPNSRWYSGSGIYRDVNLYVGCKNHLSYNPVKITTVDVNKNFAMISYEVSSIKDKLSDYRFELSIFYNGELIQTEDGESGIVSIELPKLWSAEEPNLYQYRVRMFEGDKLVDEDTGRFGIRMVETNRDKGLLINGNKVILIGACIHHDNGVLGAISLPDAERRKIRILKENGFNAIRSAHNPISKNLLEACDELGMYVMDEAFDMWFSYKTEYDYAKDFRQDWEKDLEAMVCKDYNHPSVIMYSIGNEIIDTISPRATTMTKRLVDKIRSIDQSRLIINCINPGTAMLAKTTNASPEEIDVEMERAPGANLLLESSEGNDFLIKLIEDLPGVLSGDEFSAKTEKLFSYLDVVGYNYAIMAPECTKEKYPERINCGSENFPSEIIENFKIASRSGDVIGDFVWTGWDYIGEACIGSYTYGDSDEGLYKKYPALLAGCGIIDLIGFPTQQAYFRQIVCNQISNPYITVRPMDLDIANTYTSVWRQFDGIASWSWAGYEDKLATVEVYSNGAFVELYLNNELIAKNPVNNYLASFEIPYEQGSITAIQYDENGVETGKCSLKSADKQTYLKIDVEKDELLPNGQDLSFINIELADKNGILKVAQDQEIYVEVNGAGYFAGLGSGNPMTVDEFASGKCCTYRGRALLVVRSGFETGDIFVKIV